jgi:hypothetical protein
MRTSTISEIQAGSQEGLQSHEEAERMLFTRVVPRRKNHFYFTADGVNCFYNFDIPNAPAPWDENVKITQDLISHGLRWDQRESVGQHEIPSSEWPTAGSRRLTDWLETSAIRVGHQMAEMVRGPEKTTDSTATNFVAAGDYGLLILEPAYNADEHLYWVKLIKDALRRSPVVTVIPSHEANPIPSETSRSLERIKELPDNWDGDGASRINEKTVSKAERLIREAFMTSPNKLDAPSVAPGFGGMIVAEWSGPEGRELILDIPPGDEAPGFLLVERSTEGNEIETDDELGPTWSMSELIARLLGD